MALVVHTLTYPANLASASNGNLPADLLTTVSFPGRGNGRLHFNAARSWYAFAADCLSATGVILTITSTADAYRAYSIQLSAFLTRYEPVSYVTYLLTASTKRKVFSYNGSTYWRIKPGYATAASPGTSNHGWGLALDVAELSASGVIVGISSSRAWSWILANAVNYGFSWETQSEPWHLRLFVGDYVPAAVTAHENGNETSDIPPFDPVWGKWGLWPVAVKPRLGVGSKGDAVKYLQGVIFHMAGGNITVDGDFGAKTAQRVKDVQNVFGYTPDGWVGSQTWTGIDYLAGQWGK
jgi:hypothetical protein